MISTVTSAPATLVEGAAFPRVNLLPPEIRERERLRKLQAGLGSLVVAAVGVVGLLYLHEAHGVDTQRQRLADAQVQVSQLTSKVGKLHTVSEQFAAASAAEATEKQALAPEIAWSAYLTDIATKIPDNIFLTTLSLSAGSATSGTPGTPGTTGTPGAVGTTGAAGAGANGAGTVSVSGIGKSYDDVARWLEFLASEKGFTGATLASTTEGAGTSATFTSSAQITAAARCNDACPVRADR